MNDLKITTLVEDTASGRELLGEHGLAFWIECGGARILFDTGQGQVLNPNARRLGVRLNAVDSIVLSHGHYDHTGGLLDALRAARSANVYAHPAALKPKFARNADETSRYVGVSEMEETKIRELAAPLWTQGPTEIASGVHITGPIPRRTPYEDTGGDFFLDPQCETVDDLIDDQAVFIETSCGIVVVLGCAHAGVINTLAYIEQLTAGQPIHTVMGGMHLLHASPERLDQTMMALAKRNISRFMPCHCTGMDAIVRLWNEFPSQCQPCLTGTTLVVDR